MSQDALFFGSREWFEAAKKTLSEDPDLVKASATWEGAIRCVIDAEDDDAVKAYTSEEGIRALLGMLAMLSPEDRQKYKATGLQKVFEKIGFTLDDLPDQSALTPEVMSKIKELTIKDFKDITIYTAFDAFRGELRAMDPIAPDAKLDARFTITGKYKHWKTMCSGQASVIQLIVTGKMKLKGELLTLMKHTALIDTLVKTFKSIPIK
ncbi:MAG: SCP2 sterol-binding domain-containing protein [Acidobacteriota bacterium]